jgi:hypothetical protein
VKIRDEIQQHLDRFLPHKPDQYFVEDRLAVGIAVFRDQPCDGLVLFLTVGLSEMSLEQASGNPIRQELLMNVQREWADLPWQELILGVAARVQQTRRALPRGYLLRSNSPLLEEATFSNLTTFVAVPPAFMPDGFFEVQSTDPPTIFVELAPITQTEVKLIEEEGFESFATEVHAGTIDLLDLKRGCAPQ